MPVPAKMNAFEGEVGGNEQISSLLGSQDSTVVSDSDKDGGVYWSYAPVPLPFLWIDQTADLGNQRFFCEWHSVTNISDMLIGYPASVGFWADGRAELQTGPENGGRD